MSRNGGRGHSPSPPTPTQKGIALSRYQKIYKLVLDHGPLHYSLLLSEIVNSRGCKKSTAEFYIDELITMGAIDADEDYNLVANTSPMFTENINGTEMSVLKWLNDRGGCVQFSGASIPQSIATDTGTSSSTASRVLDRLAFRGYITIERNSEKKRIECVVLDWAPKDLLGDLQIDEVEESAREWITKDINEWDDDPIGIVLHKLLVEINRIEKRNKELEEALAAERTRWDTLREVLSAQ